MHTRPSSKTQFAAERYQTFADRKTFAILVSSATTPLMFYLRCLGYFLFVSFFPSVSLLYLPAKPALLAIGFTYADFVSYACATYLHMHENIRRVESVLWDFSPDPRCI